MTMPAPFSDMSNSTAWKLSTASRTVFMLDGILQAN